MATQKRPMGLRRPTKDHDPSYGETVFSPVCTYCYWWKVTDGHYCGAWPPGGARRIPDTIWNGHNSHMYAIGTERKDERGQPIVFRLHPDAVRENLPTKLARDLAARETKEATVAKATQ